MHGCVTVCQGLLMSMRECQLDIMETECEFILPSTMSGDGLL